MKRMDTSIILILQAFVFLFTLGQGQVVDNDTVENDNTTAASRRTHQITSILDRLLEDYDANIRPNFGGRWSARICPNELLFPVCRRSDDDQFWHLGQFIWAHSRYGYGLTETNECSLWTRLWSFLVVHNELLLSTAMARRTFTVRWRSRYAFAVHTHARTPVETWYDLLQFEIFLLTYHTNQ